MARAVDLDLFVNSASKGFQDGAKVPSGFASFVGSFFDGLDASAKYQTELQNQEIRAAQIENIPTQTRILEAEADIKEAQAADLQTNGSTIAEAKRLELENKLAQEKREQAMLQKESTFSDIMNKGTPEQKAEATLSGQYSDLLALKPGYYDMARSSVPSWSDKAQQDLFWKRDNEKAVQGYWAKDGVINEVQRQDAKKAFDQSAGIDTLVNQLPGSSRPDLLLKGKVKRELIGDLTKTPIIDPKTKQPQVIEGKPQYEIKPRTSGDMKWQDVFYYEDKPIYGVDPETLKTVNQYQNVWNTDNQRQNGQGGATDAKAETDRINEAKAVAKAEAEQKGKELQKQQQTSRESFLSGMAVQSPVAKSSPSPVSEPTRTNVPRPSGTPSEITNAPIVVSPAASPRSAEARQGPALTPVPSMTATPTSDKAFSVKEREELNRAKVRELTKRRQEQNGPVQNTSYNPNATPQQQAAQATAPRNIPNNIAVNISREYPNEKTVQRVLAVPALEDTSALFKAVVAVESRGFADAVSPTGVTGLAQTTLDTAQDIDPTIKSRAELKDPAKSARIGGIRLQSLYKVYESSPMLALIGYNAGPAVAADIAKKVGFDASWEEIEREIPSSVSKYYTNKNKIEETLNYPKRVMSYFPKFIQYQSDMQLAEKLKEQGIISYGNDPNMQSA